MKKRNSNIEAIRGIASILIVFIHFPVENSWWKYLVAIAKFGVPFFLMVSGYFSYHNTNEENILYAKKRLVSTIKITVLGIAICSFVNTLLCYFQGDNCLQWLLDRLNKSYIIKFLVFNRTYGVSFVMYYLFMLIYVYILYIIINKLKLIKLMYFLIPILLLLNVIVSKSTDKWYFAGNFFLTGIPFFGLGNYIRYKHMECKQWMLFSAIIVGIFISIIEAYFNGNCYLYIGSIPLSVGIFIFGISTERTIFPKFMSLFGSNYSMLIFLLHVPTGQLIMFLLACYGIDHSNFLPFVVIFITIIISIIIVLFKKSFLLLKIKTEQRNNVSAK